MKHLCNRASANNNKTCYCLSVLYLHKGVRIISIFVIILVFFACKEEPIGQYPIDSTPPKPVSNPIVENFSGGAKITYQLPDETDLLYVKTEYTLPNGTVREMKASAFTNFLVVKGFARSEEMELKLVAVDMSYNESEAIPVVIKPEDAAIYTITENLDMTTAFGGFYLNWENPSQEDVTVTVLKLNDSGDYELIDVLYSSAKTVNTSIRGQDSVMTTFGVVIKDLFENTSDTVTADIKPLYEVQLDRRNFLAMPTSSKFGLQPTTPTDLAVLWDNVLITGARECYYIIPGSGYKPYITMDLGTKAKLSRFRFWGREDYYFRLHNPRLFYILGTNDESVARDTESDDSKWILLGEYESIRPSGLSSDIPATEEDYAYAAAGEEYDVSIDASPVRYIRFKSHISWSGTDGMHLGELRFWGTPLKD